MMRLTDPLSPRTMTLRRVRLREVDMDAGDRDRSPRLVGSLGEAHEGRK
jgi:hypothetical protein